MLFILTHRSSRMIRSQCATISHRLLTSQRQLSTCLVLTRNTNSKLGHSLKMKHDTVSSLTNGLLAHNLNKTAINLWPCSTLSTNNKPNNDSEWLILVKRLALLWSATVVVIGAVAFAGFRGEYRYDTYVDCESKSNPCLHCAKLIGLVHMEVASSFFVPVFL